MKPKYIIPLFLAIGLFLSYFPSLVQAQDEPDFRIRLSRDFGTDLGGRIEGTFSIHASGPDNLISVIFYLDETSIGEDTEPPFRLQFQTGSFPPGNHTLSAVGTTSDGQELTANVIGASFMSAEESREGLLSFMIPVLGLIVVIALLSMASAVWAARRNKLEPGAVRHYGMAGGAICPRCKRAYPRHFLSPNMLLGKLERCPFCGKWAIVAAAHPALLAAAEEAERQSLQEHVAESPISPEEKHRHRLDDSRFEE
ncbi:MAG: hypothetical protein KA314_13880 [Chloroflexi bacterium]|nr:hypothetical protein [Chloroflexota bacterium]MBP8056923.1 hypothetical protein [Chloroflexota bacterium]